MENQTQPSAQNDPAVVKYHSPKDVLIAARKLIEKPECWGQGLRAEEQRKTYCASEAIEHASDRIYRLMRPAFDRFAAAARLSHKVSIPRWNDEENRTHADVLAAFDRAIEQCGTVTSGETATPAAAT